MARRRRPHTSYVTQGPRYSPPLANLRLDPRILGVRREGLRTAAPALRTYRVHRINKQQLDRAKPVKAGAARSAVSAHGVPTQRNWLQALVCSKRQERKEVLFAHKKAGGGGISRRRRRSILSTIICS